MESIEHSIVLNLPFTVISCYCNMALLTSFLLKIVLQLMWMLYTTNVEFHSVRTSTGVPGNLYYMRLEFRFEYTTKNFTDQSYL